MNENFIEKVIDLMIQKSTGRVNQKGNEVIFEICPYCDGGAGKKDKYKFAINRFNGFFQCFRAKCVGKSGGVEKLNKDFNLGVPYPKRNEIITSLETREREREFTTVPPQAEEKLKIAKDDKAIKYFKSRGIDEDIIKRYGIINHKDEDKIIIPAYDEKDELVFVKIKYLSKESSIKESFLPSGCKMILHGIQGVKNTKSDTLIITEGIPDALSVAQAGYDNVVSVPNGCNGMTWFTHSEKFLEKFNNIILFGDNDKGGEQLKRLFVKQFKGTQWNLKIVQPNGYEDCKDANEILIKRGIEGIRKCVNTAKSIYTEVLKDLADVPFDSDEDTPRIVTSIPRLNTWTNGGIPKGALVVLSGKAGEGKSTFLSQLVADCIDQDIKCVVYAGESTNSTFKTILSHQIVNSSNLKEDKKPIEGEESTRTKILFKNNDIKYKVGEWLRNKVDIFDDVKDCGFKEILEAIEYSIRVENAGAIFIDNLMTAVDLEVDSKDLSTVQGKFVKDLKMLTRTYGCTIFLVAHQKKTDLSLDVPDVDTVQGSSNIVKLSDLVLFFRRTIKMKDDEDEEQGFNSKKKNELQSSIENAHDCVLSISKNRRVEGCGTARGMIYLNYDRLSKQILQGTHGTLINNPRCIKEIKTKVVCRQLKYKFVREYEELEKVEKDVNKRKAESIQVDISDGAFIEM